MQRLNPFAIVPDAYKAVSGVESYIRNCGLEKSLIHLVKMRASQINGCAYCLEIPLSFPYLPRCSHQLSLSSYHIGT